MSPFFKCQIYALCLFLALPITVKRLHTITFTFFMVRVDYCGPAQTWYFFMCEIPNAAFGKWIWVLPQQLHVNWIAKSLPGVTCVSCKESRLLLIRLKEYQAHFPRKEEIIIH